MADKLISKGLFLLALTVGSKGLSLVVPLTTPDTQRILSEMLGGLLS